ncbi:helix-turn-helix domain-containing protein [Cystobacter fuscus]|uniref:helix-turn-helix domain-containing protein n=1 Tax=Cystobacter fuscus TaxID=43 RepID=UPI0009715301|nr:LysR family transcriptional regulator [Cystobacter fuscus]
MAGSSTCAAAATAARTGQVSAASRLPHLSRPAVTAQVRQLEREPEHGCPSPGGRATPRPPGGGAFPGTPGS